MQLAQLLSTGPGLVGLLTVLVAAIVGLPLFLVSRHLHLLEVEDTEDAPAWWHSSSSSMADEGERAGGAGGKLVGGSRTPALDACQQCGAEQPAHRCAGCRTVAYCSRPCQQKHWQAGHKHECKKLRKQQAAAVKLGSTAAAAAPGSKAVVPGPGVGQADAAGQSTAGGERPQDSNSTLPVPKQVIYPATRYLELTAAPPQRKQPLGLQNVGNSCYANSLLQSLLATPALAAYLVSGEHGRGCLKPSASDWCVLCELEKLAQQAYRAGGSSSGVLNPKPLLRNVKRLGKQFSFGRQEDSHELYLRLMEAVEAVQLLEAGGKSKYDLRSRETALIHHIFAGYTRGQIECLSCGHISRTYECCTSLTLEVSARITSLESALARFTAAERLDGDNRYKCDGCKAYVPADRSTRLEAAPNSLQICLKRFAPGRYGKITTRLSFPETLDMRPYMADGCLDGDDEPLLYSLYAVVVHIDWGRSTDYGHYIAYVKSGDSWFQCDDSTVTKVAAAKVLAAGAYLLFYQRQQPREILAADSLPQEKVAAMAAKPAVAAAASGSGMEEGGQRDSMLRVETAPASLPHLSNQRAVAPDSPGSTSGLSAASSQGQLQEEPERQRRQQGQQQRQRREEDIEIGTPEKLHASASESDLAAARQSCSAAAAAAARAGKNPCSTPRAAAALGQQPEQRPAVAADSGSTSSSTYELGEETEDSDSASPHSGSLKPGINPFSMLGSEDANSSGSSSSSSSDDDAVAPANAAGAAEAALGEAAARAAGPAAKEAAHRATSADQQQAGAQTACSGSSDWQAQLPALLGTGSSSQEHEGLATEAPRTPTHRAHVSSSGDGKRTLRLSIELPGVQDQGQVDWQLAAVAGAGPQQQQQLLSLQAREWALQLPLPVPVAADAGTAKFAASRHKLTVTWPVASP